MQLNQLLEVFSELDPPFRDYTVIQIKKLLEAQQKNKKEAGHRQHYHL
jgi:hypothetical protein